MKYLKKFFKKKLICVENEIYFVMVNYLTTVWGVGYKWMDKEA